MTTNTGQETRPTTRNSTRQIRHFGSQTILDHTLHPTAPSTATVRRSARLNPTIIQHHNTLLDAHPSPHPNPMLNHTTHDQLTVQTTDLTPRVNDIELQLQHTINNSSVCK